MLKFFPKSVSFLMFAAACGSAHATGDFGSDSILSGEEATITGTPEFFWELECKRIALEFVPEEKRVIPPAPDIPNDQPTTQDNQDLSAANVDLRDFKAALKDGSIKTADPVAATRAYVAARQVVEDASSTRTGGVLPDEAPGEFALYNEGALAYKIRHPDKAAAAWSALLAMPAAERKYRSTWAAYMLGRSALDEHEFQKAAGYFKQTRTLAKEGFVDSLALVDASYGWEARCELELGNSDASARLYLNQLAIGDLSAVVSLKWFIPDWGMTVKNEEGATPGFGINYEESGEIIPMQPGPAAMTPRGEKALADAARSPLLRRLVTVHILATSTDRYSGSAEAGPEQTKWLAALDRAGVKETPDAEFIGWVAYSAGKYDDAKRWLAKSLGTSPAALWLKAKFSLRDGKLAEGTALLSQALQAFRDPHPVLGNSAEDGRYHVPPETASGELGVLRLAQSDFVQALDAFISANMWEDAAYIAERCLTTAELLDYCRKQKFPATTPAEDPHDHANSIPNRFRDLVARRMVREDDYPTAREFFSADKIKFLDDYTAALAKGTDKSISKQQQARALFHAAWIARYKGMELMGTEAGPDYTFYGGAFSDGDLAMARLTGKEPAIDDRLEDSGTDGQPVHFPLPVSSQEKERLQTTKLVVERRFHYRHVAAGLAWKAAELLPDNTKELADVLGTAETWLYDRHRKQAERFERAYKKRCSKVVLGKNDSPWSDEEGKLLPPES